MSKNLGTHSLSGARRPGRSIIFAVMPGSKYPSQNLFILAFACASLLSAGAGASVTYYFEWYCSGCAKLGKGSNGKEGPFGSGSVCEAARASLSGSLGTRGCGSRCFNPLPCVSVGQPDAAAEPRLPPAPPAAVRVAPIYDPLAERVRRADELKRGKEKGAPLRLDAAGKWRNSFSWYEARASKEAIEIVLVETCRTPDCTRRDYPNRPVFRGKLEGSRLVGVVPIRAALESEQSGKQCTTPTGEFPAQGNLSEDGRTINWRPINLPVVEGCAPVSISLGTWRRG